MQNTSDKQDGMVQIFEDASLMAHEHVKEQLSYRQMLSMANLFLEWATIPEVTPDRAVRLVGQANAMQQLAEVVGPSWAPPEPDCLSLVGFLARQCE